MAQETNPILYQVDGAVARVTLNRPEKRNALNDALVSALKDALRRANNNAAVRVVVISGAGRDFCSGADLAALQKIADGTVAENLDDARSLMELFTLIRQVAVPVIAAVRGKALAGGCGLASACDLVLASTTARFGYPEVKIGFVPAMVMAILRRNVSEKRAFELLTRGAEIGADEAKEIGLANQVFSEADFEDEVTAYVRGFEQMSKAAVALTKTLLYQMDGMAFGAALETGVDVNVMARMTEDCQKGIASFLKKK
ncbi:MAG TPA: enoyl-CoA hydratase-related protein [Pyrinomonadaceae bacterium]|jgi:methylglutaconyl-CoA hydratase|nr:enoyl-CoA hydratase-related protein [Pyrinomonadaceae bacterium]